MLDGRVRKGIDPALDRMARVIAAQSITANQVTLAGCAIGLLGVGLIAANWLWAGLLAILVSRVADGLDGAVARIKGRTDFGGYLDIVLDFLFYGAVPFGFVLLDPAANGLAGAALILSFYVNGASFLAYAVMAEKRGLESQARGDKSLFFTTGLPEATATIAVFVAM